MCSIYDIIKTVETRKNILDVEEISNIIKIIKNAKIENEDIFSKQFQYNINLFENKYITENIFTNIKNKFNYEGVLENVYCKILSYDDIEKYKKTKEDENYSIFSLDLNKKELNVTQNDIIEIIKNKGYKEEDINNILNDEYSQNSLFSEIDVKQITNPLHKQIITEYNLEMQNLNDFHSYLYFLPTDNEGLFGVSYEHINNNCIKFPGHYIQKKKSYHRLINQRVVSVIFICKNI